MNKPKVSVIIPVYGVEKYIERCARSLFEQTLEDIEFIFVDDCSIDNSIPILRKTLEDYPLRVNNVRILRMPRNSGQAEVRKHGVLNANGDYIIHCDSDDWVDINAYKEAYDYAISGGYNMVFFDYMRSDGKKHTPVQANVVTNDKLRLLSQLLSGEVMGSLWKTLVHNELYRDITFPKYNMIEDLTTMVQLVYNSESIAYLSKPLYYYYWNPDSISMKSTKEHALQKITQSSHNLNQIINCLSNKGLNDYFKDELRCMKTKIKMNLSPYMLDFNIRKEWFKTYPEITNNTIYTNKYLPFNYKLIYISSVLGIYPLYIILRRQKVDYIISKFRISICVLNLLSKLAIRIFQ